MHSETLKFKRESSHHNKEKSSYTQMSTNNWFWVK